MSEKRRDNKGYLLKTGLRISELCGLTRQDIDFEDKVIHVNHQLLYSKELTVYHGTLQYQYHAEPVCSCVSGKRKGRIKEHESILSLW